MQLKDPLLFRQQCYINGEWLNADSGKTFNVTNPATDAVIGNVPDMGAAETKRAIAAAEAAFPAWSKKTSKERSIILRKWFDLIIAHTDDLARLMVIEQGKPKPRAKWPMARRL
jgi:succinate-semialdehyde dehydrogenase / glutarate-semialdehyde dehydrogenase